MSICMSKFPKQKEFHLLLLVLSVCCLNIVALSCWDIDVLFYAVLSVSIIWLVVGSATLFVPRIWQSNDWTQLFFPLLGYCVFLLITLFFLAFVLRFVDVRYSLFWGPLQEATLNKNYENFYTRIQLDATSSSTRSPKLDTVELRASNLTFVILSSKRKPETILLSVASLFRSLEYAGYGADILIGDTQARKEELETKLGRFSRFIQIVPLKQNQEQEQHVNIHTDKNNDNRNRNSLEIKNDWHFALYTDTLKLLKFAATSANIKENGYLIFMEDDAIAGKATINQILQQVIPKIEPDRSYFGLLRLWTADKFRGWGRRTEILPEVCALVVIPSIFVFILFYFGGADCSSYWIPFSDANSKLRFSLTATALFAIWILIILYFIGRQNVVSSLAFFFTEAGGVYFEHIPSWSGNTAVMFDANKLDHLIKYLESYTLGSVFDGWPDQLVTNKARSCRSWDRKVNTTDGLKCALAIDFAFSLWAYENELTFYGLQPCLFQHIGFNSSFPGSRQQAFSQTLTCRSFQYDAIVDKPFLEAGHSTLAQNEAQIDNDKNHRLRYTFDI
uniref:Uncharacterized protein n=1 Tax=Aplanochytrium stocchinoi TaxID=215587 RepID=A0A7S3LQU1_9STRA|mmetsp:Transcript_34745/g.42863  ORF Transcript_34745/g.42863 Transcript_34745/m.42863 type:complete len:561 (+) Transcript_34745:208-1890(+)